MSQKIKPVPLDLLQFPTYITPRRDFSESDSIPEYDSDADGLTTNNLNLGAESPASVLHADITDVPSPEDDWSKSGIAVHTNVPSRNRHWRSNSFSKKKRDLQRELVDRDCGICFEIAVVPCRTQCCGKLFCLEHLTEWLHGSSSDGRCPSCKAPCTLGLHTIPVASTSIPPTPPTPLTDPGFIPMTSSSSSTIPSSSTLFRPNRYMTRTPSGLSRSTSPHPQSQSHLHPLSAGSSSADLYSSSSSSASNTSTGSASGDDESRSASTRTRGNANSNVKQHSSPFSLATWSNPEFMGGAVERILSLVGLTLLFYVLLS